MSIEHSTIQNANCHEPKHITDSTTADTGKVITPSSSSNGVSEFRKLALADISDMITNDRFNYQGWGSYIDSETSPATIVFNTTPAKIQIDGTGATSRSTHLPIAIRGTSELWDSATDKINPVEAGDTYDIRVDLEITGTSGAPNYLELVLDIGGGASPTIPIVTRVVGLVKTPPFSLSLSFCFYAYDTFKTNGGQLFLSTDTGTATVAGRGINIMRTGSGLNGTVV